MSIVGFGLWCQLWEKVPDMFQAQASNDSTFIPEPEAA